MRQVWTAVLAMLGCGLALAQPTVFQCDGTDLLSMKARYDAGETRVVAWVDAVQRDADEALQLPVQSVTFKPYTPPSGDKHDYMSLSPYWWPDPSTPDGLPYIRRDGEFNPERAKYDLDPLENMARSVDRLATAYYFTRHEPYAAKATQLIRAWFLAPETRMNPNLRYAQFIPGRDVVRGAGVIEGGRFRQVVDADGLLQGSAAWTAADSAGLKDWFAGMLEYLQTSEQGRLEAAAENNHGTWYGVQVATYALYLGREDVAREALLRHGRDAIARHVEPDGRQPHELARTRAFDYSRYNILGHIELAMLAQRLDIDLWNYRTDDGRSLRGAIDWLLPFATEDKPWEHAQIAPRKIPETASVLRRAARAYAEPAYELAIARLPGFKELSAYAELRFPSTTPLSTTGQ